MLECQEHVKEQTTDSFLFEWRAPEYRAFVTCVRMSEDTLRTDPVTFRTCDWWRWQAVCMIPEAMKSFRIKYLYKTFKRCLIGRLCHTLNHNVCKLAGGVFGRHVHIPHRKYRCAPLLHHHHPPFCASSLWSAATQAIQPPADFVHCSKQLIQKAFFIITFLRTSPPGWMKAKLMRSTGQVLAVWESRWRHKMFWLSRNSLWTYNSLLEMRWIYENEPLIANPCGIRIHTQFNS